MNTGHTQQALGEIATAKVRALCSGFDLVHLSEPMVRCLAVIGRGWWDEARTDRPPFENDLTDDGSPFELSVAFEGGRCQLRALAESRDRPYTLEANWSAGLETSERMSREFGADVRGLDGLLELFAPKAPRGRPYRTPSSRRSHRTTRSRSPGQMEMVPVEEAARRVPPVRLSDQLHCRSRVGPVVDALQGSGRLHGSAGAA